jgi:hypothetical protein
MSPSAAVALALLGFWILAVFVVTNAAGADQLRATAHSDEIDHTGGSETRTAADSPLSSKK